MTVITGAFYLYFTEFTESCFPSLDGSRKKTTTTHNLISGKMLIVWDTNQLGIKLREPAYLLQICVLEERVFNINNLLLIYE